MILRRFGCLAMLLTILWALPGCGSSGEENVAANIEGGTEEATDDLSPGGAAGPKQRKPAAPPRVVVSTSAGEFTVQLDPAKAPLTVDNFLGYAESGHYDGTIFHQAVEGYIVLAGGYSPDLAEKPVQTPIRNEAHNGLTNRRGTIAMARQYESIDSSTSQFFINLDDNAALDHKGRTLEEYGYCVFGEVVSGMEVVEKIGKSPVKDVEGFEKLPTQAVVIKSVKVLR